MTISVIFHHKGEFTKVGRRRYLNGELVEIEDLDEDKFSYFEVIGILKDGLGHSGNLKLWWKGKKEPVSTDPGQRRRIKSRPPRRPIGPYRRSRRLIEMRGSGEGQHSGGTSAVRVEVATEMPTHELDDQYLNE
ncbi:hypothetical protein SESBI_45312 [Sesbania bispinosa]|nr:hypothetical protein SESBI_45312 [Sesbania bispinosa]